MVAVVYAEWISRRAKIACLLRLMTSAASCCPIVVGDRDDYILIRSAQPNITYLYYPILSKIEEENHQDFDKNIYLFRFIWVRRVLVWASKEGAGNQPEDFIKLTRTHGEHGMLLRRDITKGRIYVADQLRITPLSREISDS